jgi:hypothetical protein
MFFPHFVGGATKTVVLEGGRPQRASASTEDRMGGANAGDAQLVPHHCQAFFLH